MLNRIRNNSIPFIISIITCSPLSTDRDRDSLAHPGMALMRSAGKTIQQGWDDPSAVSDEKPGMLSSLSYNYWIDTTEVTQTHYFDLMGTQPVPFSSAYGAGDNYPIYNVSWFDAVLYCNARSRSEGLDSVYGYSGRKKSPDGRVYELTGLSTDFSRDGYRLPTETEWEYAAREGSSTIPFCKASDSVYACSSAWFAMNSMGRSHPVASLKKNAVGLYDMAGNVFEWTNDWKGLYNGKSIVNSLGTFQPDNDYEKVIKGGSYNYPLPYLRPSRRSATYSTILSSANEYVGFRCARGIIPDGNYIGMAVSDFKPNPVSISISGSDLRSFVGTTESKIVFVNVSGLNRTLCCVNFSRTFPYVQEYLDDKCVYMPTISPDGRYAAYCSRNQGVSGRSSITIRSLDSLGTSRVQLESDSAYMPQWWVDQAKGDTCIVYTNSAESNGSPSWKMTRTFSQRMSAGRPAGTREELVPDGSYHDGLSTDGQFIVTSYTRLMMKNLAINGEKQLFTAPGNGKVIGGSDQACNASISPDSEKNNRCLFLDFGSPGVNTVTGCSYGIHQYLFVTSFSDSILNYIRCPSNKESWDYPKWSNRGRFAIACGRNQGGQADAVYAVDLINRSYRQVVTGAELQHPYFWIGAVAADPFGIAVDSLGVYNDPPSDGSQACMATKILTFWRIFDSLEIAALGSSQVFFGLDVQQFVGFKSYNFAAPGGDLPGQKNIILHYVIPHCSKIKAICSSLDIGWLGNFEGNYSWKNGIGSSKGFTYDSCHDFWNNGSLEIFRNNIRYVPFPAGDTVHLGCNFLPSNGWGAVPPPCSGSLLWTFSDSNCQQNLAAIHLIADSLRLKGIHWIIINFPVSPNYKNSASYSTFGPSWQTAREIVEDLRELDSANLFFHLYDANKDGDHDYGDFEAYNENHLSAAGGAKLSLRVDSLINAILRK
jgi:uncharacterized protein (TIGR02171 family)